MLMFRSYKLFLTEIALALGLLLPLQVVPALAINTNVGATATSGTSASGTSVKSNTSVKIEGEIKINRADVEAEDRLLTKSAQTVNTSADLNAYAAGAITGDEGVDSMNFSGDAVEVRYKQRGRLLAVIPMTFYVTAVAHSNGEVEVEYPWYSFLTVDNRTEVETQVDLAVEDALVARANAAAKVGGAGNLSFTPRESAIIASQMHAVLRSSFETE
jgi:hypothetical protein